MCISIGHFWHLSLIWSKESAYYLSIHVCKQFEISSCFYLIIWKQVLDFPLIMFVNLIPLKGKTSMCARAHTHIYIWCSCNWWNAFWHTYELFFYEFDEWWNVITCSGYGIAAQALTAVVRAHDGRGPQTALTDCILKALSLSSPDELIGYLSWNLSWWLSYALTIAS